VRSRGSSPSCSSPSTPACASARSWRCAGATSCYPGAGRGSTAGSMSATTAAPTAPSARRRRKGTGPSRSRPSAGTCWRRSWQPVRRKR
jgi:hypothetical protein